MNKITDSELKNIKAVQEKYGEIVVELGKYEIDIVLLNAEIDKLKDMKSKCINDIMILKTQEEQIVLELKTKYPDAQIDLTTGDIM